MYGNTGKNPAHRGLFLLLLTTVLLIVLLIAMTIGFGVQIRNRRAADRNQPQFRAQSQNMETTTKKVPGTTESASSSQATPGSASMTSSPMAPTTTAPATSTTQSPFLSPQESCPFNKPMYRDCKDALRKGYNFTGLVNIKPDLYTSEFQVYCDMESDGGGWTLVASIHEDAIRSKCNYKDVWSRTSSSLSSTNQGFENWFNLLTFGDLFDVTGNDYKSNAMYSVKGSDVMIWHVPNDVRLSEISDQAFFKYHTTTGFLSKYGSNLHQLFTKYYPMNRVYPKDLAKSLITCVEEETWSSLWSYSWNRGSFLQPVSITYDNLIQVIDDEKSLQITSSGDYVNGSLNVQASLSQSSNKLSALLWFSGQQHGFFDVKVGRKGIPHNSTLRTGRTTYQDYTIRFAAACGATVCKILFHIINYAEWGLAGGEGQVTFRDVADGIRMRHFATGQPFLVGYAAFRKKYERYPTTSDWASNVRDLPRCFDLVNTQYGDIPSLSVPAKFIKGEMNYDLSDVTPGFIEFRKYDSSGYPYPLCPGIRLLNDTNPALHCIGGIRTGYSTSDRASCGDFAAWDQLEAHTAQRATTSDGKKVTDLTSSLLLFYR